jgi:mono/diheme cytochrome c family protein
MTLGARSRAATAGLLLAGLLLAGAACGDDAGTAGAGTAGQEVAIEAHPEGHEVYQQRCASCHGADLSGTGTGPSLRSIVYEPGHHPDGAFRQAILHGSPQHHWDFGDMLEMGQGLSDDTIDEIIAYVRVVQEEDGFED